MKLLICSIMPRTTSKLGRQRKKGTEHNGTKKMIPLRNNIYRRNVSENNTDVSKYKIPNQSLDESSLIIELEHIRSGNAVTTQLEINIKNYNLKINSNM